MKLCATLTTERGKKVSKTGNDFIDIELSAFKDIVGHITIHLVTDTNDEMNQYLIEWHPRGLDAGEKDYIDPVILKEGHSVEGEIQVLRK